MNGDVRFKEKFLNEIDKNYTDNTDATMRQYKIFFNNSVLEMKELLLAKDLYDFAEKEVEDFLYDLRVRNLNTLAGYFSLLRKYLLYAQDQKVSVQSVNTVIGYTRDDLRRYIDATGEYEQYMTKNELRELILKREVKTGDYIIKNAQERAMYVVIYNGLLGKRGIEISELKINEIDFNNNIILTNNKLIELEDWEMDVIKEARDERTYLSYISDKEYNYIDSPYLFKSIDRVFGVNDTENTSDKVSYQVIAGRIRVCSRLINKPFWKPKTIFNSGVVYKMLKEKTDWNVAEITEYIKTNKVSMNYDNLKRIFDIMKDKLDVEEISLDEVATTKLTIVK